MDLHQDDDRGRAGHGIYERERERRRQQQQQQPSTSTTTVGSNTGSPATHGQFMGDEFRAYMSRKIELQRRQFGLVLPPAPEESSPNTRARSRSSSMARMDEVAISPPTASSPPPFSSSSRKKAKLSQTSPSSTDAQLSMRSVSNATAGSSGLSGVLSRLQEKHGRGSFEMEVRMRDTQSTTPRKRRRRREERAGREHDNQDRTGNGCTAVNVSKTVGDDFAAPLSPSLSAAYRDKPTTPYTKESKSAAKSPMIDEHHLAVTKRSRPDLYFLGVVVLINGYTSPDAPTLTRMLQKHGGDVEKYETSRVTHIIASALSTAKALIYKRQRNPTPYVRPQWIVDSCKEGRLLPYAKYLLDEIRDDSVGTKTVKSFFAASTPEKSKSPAGLESDTGQKIEAGVVRRRLHDDPSIMTRGTSSNDTNGESQCSHRIPARPSRPARTVGSDPDFLDSYFRNSRLSFIGSFKQRVKNTGEASSSPARRRPANATNVDERYVFHIDIDCFFAAVALRRYPEYRNKPIGIGHGWKTDSHGRPIPVREGHAPEASGTSKEGRKKSYSELSTCNYKAREYGVKKGMFLHQAKLLCPDIVILPYDYEGYEEVSSLVADILHDQAEKFDGAVEQVSCDEAYIEIYLSKEDAKSEGHHGDLSKFVKEMAEKIRSDIYNATQCTASVGVATNKFLAKLATDKAKPDGSFIVHDCYSLLYGLKLRDLPGIGWKLDRKLRANNLETVRDILTLGDDAERRLCSLLGTGNGQKILNYIDGKDDRPVQAVQRKTIGAEASFFFAELS
mmetsp:Transcript_11852/g.24464  ORF Transcript_11852/g.24464 Transcript_11852/m.24464 type:complete len:787 (-) Transcript_11852:1170-3530(-)